MRVLLLSRYGHLGASSRVRSYQYLPYLSERGIDVTSVPLLGDAVVADLYNGRRRDAVQIAATYCRRIWRLLRSSRFDLTWVEYEILPWIPAWAERLLGAVAPSFVVDYDDAVFHRYDLHRSPLVRAFLGRKIDAVMRRAVVVIVGNQYLADRAHLAGATRVETLPSTVDLARYHVASRSPNTTYTIGWIGSPATARYLSLVRSALLEVCGNQRGRLVVVGGPPDVTTDNIPTVARPWSEATEVSEIQRFDVGIMPLPDDPWERGKCGYKLVQYMACGLPVVASPVGMNAQIVEHGVNGFLATTTQEWITALDTLRDPSLRARMGLAGRAKVERSYALETTAPRLASLLLSLKTKVP